jgi:uncharacterized membrane protein
MSSTTQIRPATGFQTKYFVFAVIAAMMAYVIYHNERFLLDPAHPVWQHYGPLKWWLLPHGLAGALALFLAPLQFSDRLRARFAKVHRVIGRIYVATVFILAPFGVYIQYLDEAQGAGRSFTIATMVDATLAITTTGFALYFALKRMIPQHRQWITRSYAVSLVFIQVRVFLGLTGLDQGPPDWHVVEVTVWVCIALAVLVGDIANQVYELRSARPRPVRTPQAQVVGANPAGS